MIRSIFSKLMISHLVVILISTLTFGLLMSYLIREHIIESKRQELLSKGLTVISLLEPSLESGKVTEFQTLPIIGELVGATVWLIDENGTVIAGNPPPRWVRAIQSKNEKIIALFHGEPQTWTRTGLQQVDAAVVVALPLVRSETPTALFLYTPIVGINKTIDAIETLLGYSLLLGILIAAAFGFKISRSLTRPIASIARAARSFAQGDYSSRALTTGKDEIGELGRTFNTMAQAIADIDKNRRDFLANVTHELKTPIASIQALTEAILDGLITQPEQQQRYLTTIVGETERISRLIDNLLDLAQLEASELSIENQAVHLEEFLSVEKEKFHPLLTVKQLSIVLDIPNTLPLLYADPDRMSQVFANLISNAIRHSPPASIITISAEAAASWINISVSDQGPGIPVEALPFIWDRFYRVDQARSRSHGGTGLGLTITKKLLQAMGGEINAVSQPGHGTTFTFTLPIVDEL
ncbi:HAMP domain-containing protein [bacterium BFN5]|nr:HAMP domain-containing protein [bacterium BFN5]QJW46201.1 HAMP domain-containing protein [bacterium BFN5]